MTPKKTAADQATATPPANEPPATDGTLEHPAVGGSYVRQPDGSLKRVEFTAEPNAADEQEA